MYALGVDVGSASSKAVILDRNRKIVAAEVVQAGTGTTGPRRVMEQIFSKTGLHREDIVKLVATGYGRMRFEGADRQFSEISCHARGVHYLVPEARTILDIGGQDAKAIRLGNGGEVKQFFMNDKCAAGTGRFLEVMARVLETDLERMAALDTAADSPVSISSTCTVFAESEVISQLSHGASRENIIAGVHNSVAAKACGLVGRCGVEGTVVMTGGVAQNAGVVRAVSRELNREILVAPNPQTAGALGAALYAWDDARRERGDETG
ncbi:MAG: acyl-CoA dehydratase activase [Intestinimonas sp.]|jgi:predicted CoA-substrate-specific enzyme activase|nr:acyl-CoA dehydratase activase [Intestinimonas sp.]